MYLSDNDKVVDKNYADQETFINDNEDAMSQDGFTPMNLEYINIESVHVKSAPVFWKIQN